MISVHTTLPPFHINNTPKLTLVGAGPGDPDLITVKGVKALESAAVILYDALANPALLGYASGAIKIYVGKRRGKHSFTQIEINQMIVKYALSQGHVVRLKGGDPFVFGRGFEEIEFVRNFNIETEVIPGISSATGVPGTMQIPATVRNISRSFWVITGVTSQNKLSHDIQYAARSSATIIILMGMKKLLEITNIYKSCGRENLPIAIIQNGTRNDQKQCYGTIANILSKVEKQSISNPAVIVIGEVVRKGRHFADEIPLPELNLQFN